MCVPTTLASSLRGLGLCNDVHQPAWRSVDIQHWLLAFGHHWAVRSLGIRLWSEKLAFVALEDASDPAAVVEKWHGPVPKGAGASRLEWIRREVEQAIIRCEPDAVGVRVGDPSAPSPDLLRAEGDGVAQLAAVQAGLPVARYYRQNMQHALEATAKGAFAAFPKTDPFIRTFHTEERDAAMVALVILNMA